MSVSVKKKKKEMRARQIWKGEREQGANERAAEQRENSKFDIHVS